MCIACRWPISTEICCKQISLIVVDCVFYLYLYLLTESNNAGYGTNTTAEKRSKSNKQYHRDERKEILIQRMEGRITNTTTARNTGTATETTNAGIVRKRTNAGHGRKNSIQSFRRLQIEQRYGLSFNSSQHLTFLQHV